MVTDNKERVVYNVEDLVDLLGISISSVYKGINSGEIPSVKVGQRILVPKKMFDEWLSKRQAKESRKSGAC